MTPIESIADWSKKTSLVEACIKVNINAWNSRAR